MLKLNWGWRIAIMYGGFVAFMLFLVYRTSQVNIDLVTKNYYAEELQYQNHLDALNRSNQLSEKMNWEVSNNKITFQLPGELAAKTVSGSVQFYCPANAKNDLTVAFTPDKNGVFETSTAKMESGAYKVKVKWKAGDLDYYNEGVLNIE